MNFEQFLHDKSSTTALFKKLPSKYSLQLLQNQDDIDSYRRVSLISLDNKPIILGVSRARHESGSFINILKTANLAPIGEQLFLKTSGIIRDSMQISTVAVAEIDDHLLSEYFSSNGYAANLELYVRQSIFKKNDEQLSLTEYIFPILARFLEAT